MQVSSVIIQTNFLNPFDYTLHYGINFLRGCGEIQFDQFRRHFKSQDIGEPGKA